MVEAVTNPEIFREFYRIYSGKRMPEDIYASNTLVRELGVPRELTEECLGIIRRNGLASGLVSDQAGVLMVGAVAESEEAGYYDTESLVERRPEREDEDTTVNRSRAASEILVVAESDDPVQSEVSGLIAGLSAPCRSVSLSQSDDQVISQEFSEALDSAGGCIFLWPRDTEAVSERTSNPRVWAALGALSYRLGQKLIVVLRDGGEEADGGSLASDPVTTTIYASEGESIYPKLMAALVQTGIVRISVG